MLDHNRYRRGRKARQMLELQIQNAEKKEMSQDFIFFNAEARDLWHERHGVCKSCDGPNDPRKCGETRAVIYPSGRKIFFRKGEFMPICRKCTSDYGRRKKDAALKRDLARAHRAALPARHQCGAGYHYCSKCGLDKLHAEFSPRGRGVGLASWCKECMRAVAKDYRIAKGQSTRKVITGQRGAYIGYTILQGLDGEIVRRSYADGYSDTFADGSETWTWRQLI